MTWLGHLLSRWALVALMAAVLPLSAAAQTSGSDCRELQDPDVAEQVELCTAHAGCWLVVKAAKVCATARNFIDRLGAAIGGGVQTLFGRRKEIQPEHVWEAVQTDNMRIIETLPGARAKADAVRDIVAKAPRQATQGALAGGGSYAFYGEVKNGLREGPGTLYTSEGRILRGQWAQGHMQGVGELANPFQGGGVRTTGELVAGQITGAGYFVTAAGGVGQGQMVNGTLVEGSFKRPNGERDEGRFINGNLAEGSKYAADGSLSEKGSFRDGQLYVGERYANNGQVVASVNRPRDQMEHARALQAIAADRQAAELAQKAAAEQRFRDSLASGNAGQLFALADELKERGEADRARQALRALVTRFPDHPLAATAARQMAPAAVVAGPAQPAARPGAAATTPAGPRVSREEAMRQCMPPVAEIRQTYLQGCNLFRQTYGGESGERQYTQCADAIRSRPDAQLVDSMRYFFESQSMDAVLSSQQQKLDRSRGFANEATDRMGLKVAQCAKQVFEGAAGPTQSAAQTGAVGPFGAVSGNVCSGEPPQNAAYDTAMQRLPQNEPTTLIRGALVGIELHLRALRLCPAAPQTQQQIAALENQRAQALRTCRQIAARDNCEESPFR